MKIIEMKGNLGGFRLLGKTPEGTCAECAVAHAPEQPHNQQSLHWQYHFRERHGRWPTWHDAMRHCTAEVKAHWLRELAGHGVDVGEDPVASGRDEIAALLKQGVRCLSVRQPYAWLIANRYKPFENRDWSLKNPGLRWLNDQLLQHTTVPVLIHAAKGMTREEYVMGQMNARDHDVTLPPMESLQRGGIVGYAEITRWHQARCKLRFSFGSGLELKAMKPLPFVPCKGALGFFKPEIYRTQGISDFVTEVKP